MQSPNESECDSEPESKEQMKNFRQKSPQKIVKQSAGFDMKVPELPTI